MDFDPNHAKWQCCCCHITSGMKILGACEAIGAVVLTGVLMGAVGRSNGDVHPWTAYAAALACMLLAIGAALMVLGIERTAASLLYPILAAKAICIVVIQALVVFNIIDPYEHRVVENSTDRNKPAVTRLVLSIFLMMFVSVAIIYTMYLVVHCIRFLKAKRRMDDRRASAILAGRIQ